MVIDYSKAKLYTIRNIDTDKFYIGSTTNTLSRRFHNHKKDYENFINKKSFSNYISSFEILKGNGAYIELLRECPCQNKDQLRLLEGEEIRKHKQLCVNKRIEGRTDKQYREDNIEKQKELNKIYREDNRDKLKALNKTYRENNKQKIKERKSTKYECNCGKSILKDGLARHLRSKYHIENTNINLTKTID
jgi:predicted GIY-YIG superfamily endonuclease